MSIFSAFATLDGWVAFLTLALMEIVLGIDNIVFISILCGNLPPALREKARRTGLLGAFVTRLVFLFLMSWLATLNEELFSVLGFGFSGKQLVLFGGGLFLLYKATKEIFEKLEGAEHGSGEGAARKGTFLAVVAQIMIIDVVFSIDSVVTAVGMARDFWLMVFANVVALAVMMWVGRAVGEFVERHPSVKMLALSFLLLIGVLLLAEGFHQSVPKGYVYFAMGFSVFVEMLNLRSRARARPVELHNTPRMPASESQRPPQA